MPGNLKIFLPYLAIAILSIVLWSMIPSCEHQETDVNEPIKKEIRKEEVKADSVKKIVKAKDSIRIVEVVKWRTLVKNPERLPCDTFVKVVIQKADTIILVDSAEIANLKQLLSIDSVIIGDFKRIRQNDSIEIGRLSKKLKRSRTWIKAAFVGGAVGGFILGRL